MKTYNIEIEETVTQTFVVQANSIEEALEIGKDNYQSGEFVLEPGDVVCKKISANRPENHESIDWHEF